MAALLAIALALSARTHAAPETVAAEPLFEPRVVDARVEGFTLEKMNVSLQIAVRASRDVTIRTLTFSDGFVERVPVVIAPLEGEWPLHRGEEFVIPNRVQVTALARDALGTADLGEIVRRAAVDATATVELTFNTPWHARLFRGATEVAVTDVAFSAPMPSAPAMLQSLAGLSAGMLDFVTKQAAPFLVARQNDRPENRAVVDRFGRAVATVETDYTIEGGPETVRRSVRTLGVWWTPATYCTTREAFEPWRYNATDGVLLQLGSARVREGDTTARIRSDGRRPPVQIDLAALGRQLPRAAERGVYALTKDGPRRIRLANRTAASALVCLRFEDETGTALPLADSQGGPEPVAAFTLNRASGLVWTEAAPAADASIVLRTPVHRQSLGSPLVARGAVVGLIASPDAAWTARAVAAAAARAVRVGVDRAAAGV